MTKKKLYIADREQLTIRGLTCLIESLGGQFFVCGAGSESDQILDDLEELKPDILFIDERLTLTRNIPLFQIISLNSAEITIVQMTSGISPVENQKAGADYTVCKPSLTRDYLAGFLASAAGAAAAPNNGYTPKVKQIDWDNITGYIREHLSEDLTLEDVARQFGYNYSYFSTCFSRYAKMSFRTYINELRLQKACTILGNNRISISEAGRLAGYSSQSYFTQVFKKYMGCTPSSYQFYNGTMAKIEV